MDRRRYVAASMGIVGGTLAGCTALAGETELTEPTESREGHSVRFVYEEEDEDGELLGVYFDGRPDTPWKSVDRIPDAPGFHRLRIGIEQPGNVTLDSYRFRFEPAGDRGANIYLHPPELGHEDTFDTYRDSDWTVVEAEYDDGTTVGTGFEVFVYSDGEGDSGSTPVLAAYELILSGDGYLDGRFVARDRTTIDLGEPE